MANDKTTLTAKLVAAYVGNNQVEVKDRDCPEPC